MYDPRGTNYQAINANTKSVRESGFGIYNPGHMSKAWKYIRRSVVAVIIVSIIVAIFFLPKAESKTSNDAVPLKMTTALSNVK